MRIRSLVLPAVMPIALPCLVMAGAARGADVRAVPPASVAGSAPQTVQDTVPRPAQDAKAGNPFPCLFECFQPVQIVSAPPDVSEPVEISPRKQATRKWTRHAFAHSRFAKQEGRSVATARKINRPVAPQAVVYKPAYDRPLDAEAVPMEWRWRAEPPKAGPATAAPMQVGPFGGLK